MNIQYILFHLSSHSLHSNYITFLPSGLYSGLNSLSFLFHYSSSFNMYSIFITHLSFHPSHSLSYNSITSLPSELFNGLNSLSYLFRYYPSLISLSSLIKRNSSFHSSHYLNSNSITFLPSNVFNGLNRLLSLSLLHIVHHHIHHIDLSHNSLTYVDMGFTTPSLMFVSAVSYIHINQKSISIEYNYLVTLHHHESVINNPSLVMEFYCIK